MSDDVNNLFVFKSLLTTPSNILPFYLKQTFLLIILIFTKVKVTRWILGYLLKPFLLLIELDFLFFNLFNTSLIKWINSILIHFDLWTYEHTSFIEQFIPAVKVQNNFWTEYFFNLLLEVSTDWISLNTLEELKCQLKKRDIKTYRNKLENVIFEKKSIALFKVAEDND